MPDLTAKSSEKFAKEHKENVRFSLSDLSGFSDTLAVKSQHHANQLSKAPMHDLTTKSAKKFAKHTKKIFDLALATLAASPIP